MNEQSVELAVRYADWATRAGMASASGSGELTAAASAGGGLSLYLERGGPKGLLHVELNEEEARRLYEFLRASLGVQELQRQRPAVA